MNENLIIHLINLIKQKDQSYIDFYNNNVDSILKEVNEVLKNNNFNDIVALLDINNFYKIISKLYCCKRNLEQRDLFLGKLWAKFYENLDIETQKIFLYKIIDKKSEIDSWSFISLLNVFLEFVSDLESKFASEWFVLLSHFVDNDLCSYIFYNSLEKYILNHKKSSFNILQKYLNSEYNEKTLILMPIFLGILRTMDKELLNIIDKNLKNSNKIENLKLYYKSMLYLYKNDVKFDISKLDEILKKDIRLQEIAFYIASNLHYSFNNKQIQINIFNWILKQICLNDLTDLSKMYILQTIDFHISNAQYDYNEILNEIINILPIKKELIGLWNEITSILFKFIEDIDKFKILLKNIISKSKYDFIDNLKNLNYFTSEFVSCKNIQLYTELFFSKNKYEREFIQELYLNFNQYYIEKIELNLNAIETIDDVILEIVFKEIICKEPLGINLYLFFKAIDNILDDIQNINLKELIKQEIIEQCINYHNECFIKLSNLEKKSKLLQEALAVAEQYHTNQTKCRLSPVNSFAFPESLEIACRAKYIQNLEITESSKEKSELLNFCHSVSLLYGDKFMFYNNLEIKGNNLSGEPQNFITTSFSIESPIMYILDPCRFKYKKIRYVQDIEKLQEDIDNGK